MGAFQPSDDETHDLGTTSARWQNVHADKLVISGAANDASTLTSTLGGHLTIGGAGENQILNIASHDTVDGGLQLAGTLVTASAAELNFVDGVTSAIQTQLDAKAALAGPTFTGTSEADNLTVTGNLKLSGHTIQNSEGESTLTLDTDQKVGVGGVAPSHMLDVNGDIRVRGNVIRNSEGEATISMDADQHVTTAANLTVGGKTVLGAPTTLTISNGAVTVTKSYHMISPEGDAGADDLITINGGVDGMILILQAAGNDAITLKHNSGNLKLAASGDFSLTNTAETIQLIYNDTIDHWCEISRSSNGS